MGGYGHKAAYVTHLAMATTMISGQLAIACRAVVTAAKLCETVKLELSSLRALTKSDLSPVTVADYGAQALICKMLMDAFPKDPVVAEEDACDLKVPDGKEQLQKITSYVGGALDGSLSVKEEDILTWIDHGNGSASNERFWTLDPIDGTKGYLRGDQYAVCLALIEEGDV